MNIFKKLLQLFSRKEKTCEENSDESVQDSPADILKDEKSFDAKPNEGVHVLLEMPHNIVHPADLMQPLCIAIAYQMGEAACCSVTDIKLYSLYDCETGAFLGSFYALKCEGLFYGNIVGSPQIFSCTSKAFHMEETDKLFVPLENIKGKILVLMCEYLCRKSRLTAVCLKTMDEFMQNEEILHKFGKKTSFNEAYSFWKKKFSQK